MGAAAGVGAGAVCGGGAVGVHAAIAMSASAEVRVSGERIEGPVGEELKRPTTYGEKALSAGASARLYKMRTRA